MLADDLAKAQQREQIAVWDRGEAELRKGFPARSLSVPVDIRDRFSLFEKWCAERSCRKLPAKPWTVAAFILDQTANGRDAQGCLALLAAIAEVHNSASLSDPTSSGFVRAALKSIIKTEPPRSWNQAEKSEWAKLPPDIRDAISRHEAARNKALRISQNKLAEERHRTRRESASSEGNIENVTTS